MNEDYKLFLLLIVAFLIAPLIGLGVGEWRKQDCRVELAKAGKTVEEIQAICK
jgi:hypothetical protein